jgi:hypothetical protein
MKFVNCLFLLQINIDFGTVCEREQYGDCLNNLFQKWPSIAQKILQVRSKKNDAGEVVSKS